MYIHPFFVVAEVYVSGSCAVIMEIIPNQFCVNLTCEKHVYHPVLIQRMWPCLFWKDISSFLYILVKIVTVAGRILQFPIWIFLNSEYNNYKDDVHWICLQNINLMSSLYNEVFMITSVFVL